MRIKKIYKKKFKTEANLENFKKELLNICETQGLRKFILKKNPIQTSNKNLDGQNILRNEPNQEYLNNLSEKGYKIYNNKNV